MPPSPKCATAVADTGAYQLILQMQGMGTRRKSSRLRQDGDVGFTSRNETFVALEA